MREWVGVPLPVPPPGPWGGLMEEAHTYVAELAGVASDESRESR